MIIAREKFREFSLNEIYLFDLDKALKQELANITKLLEGLNLSFEKPEEEFDNFSDTKRFLCALETAKITKDKKSAPKIAKLVNESMLSYELMAQSALTLKELNEISLINKEVIQGIDNENVRVLIESCY